MAEAATRDDLRAVEERLRLVELDVARGDEILERVKKEVIPEQKVIDEKVQKLALKQNTTEITMKQKAGLAGYGAGGAGIIWAILEMVFS